jgi:O-antigen ligase
MRVYPAILSLIVLASATTDLMRQVSLGSITLQAAWTIIVGIGSFGLILSRGGLPKSALWGIGFTAFLGVGFISSVINLSTSSLGSREQIQDLMVYAIFAGTILLSIGEAYREPVQPPWYVRIGFFRAAQLAMGLYGLGLLLGGPGSSVIIGARSFAIYGLVSLSWLLASWRYRAQPQALIYAIGLTTMIAFSFSRTATVIALILFPLSQFSPNQPKSWLKVGLWISLISLIAYLCFNYVEPIRNRFTDSGDNGQIGGVKVNTSGRERAWEVVIQSAAEAPVFGKGPGSVGTAVGKLNMETIAHPHNDYLRLWHDFGWVGLTFWLGSYVLLLVQISRNWLWAAAHDPITAHVHQATLLSMISVLLIMLTDNIIVYHFVMASVGILIGTSLGLGQARRKLVGEVRAMQWVEDFSKINDAPLA